MVSMVRSRPCRRNSRCPAERGLDCMRPAGQRWRQPAGRLVIQVTSRFAHQDRWLAAAVVVSLAGFLQSAHLGHTIADEEIGAFDSRYTERALLQLGEERAQRWRTHPPEPQGLLAREDQYLSEALFHVQERNDGDARTAWRENRILENTTGPCSTSGRDRPLRIAGHASNGLTWRVERLVTESRTSAQHCPFPCSSGRRVSSGCEPAWPPWARVSSLTGRAPRGR